MSLQLHNCAIEHEYNLQKEEDPFPPIPYAHVAAQQGNPSAYDQFTVDLLNRIHRKTYQPLLEGLVRASVTRSLPSLYLLTSKSCTRVPTIEDALVSLLDDYDNEDITATSPVNNHIQDLLAIVREPTTMDDLKVLRRTNAAKRDVLIPIRAYVEIAAMLGQYIHSEESIDDPDRENIYSLFKGLTEVILFYTGPTPVSNHKDKAKGLNIFLRVVPGYSPIFELRHRPHSCGDIVSSESGLLYLAKLKSEKESEDCTVTLSCLEYGGIRPVTNMPQLRIEHLIDVSKKESTPSMKVSSVTRGDEEEITVTAQSTLVSTMQGIMALCPEKEWGAKVIASKPLPTLNLTFRYPYLESPLTIIAFDAEHRPTVQKFSVIPDACKTFDC
ncbi:MAG: hypothetical protein WC254_03675 [Candidatus Woesearchaeota archaeon]|jgi:hypothetical protein